MKLAYYFPIIILAIIFSCTKPPDYPIEPIIEFERLSRNSMLQGTQNNDSIVITVSFTDGDGDLGNGVDTIFDIFVKDTRIPDVAGINPAQFKMPFVPVQGVGNGISGEISILTYTTCCIYPNNAPPCSTEDEVTSMYPIDTVIYEVFIKDRAGNESNKVLTDPVLLQCDIN